MRKIFNLFIITALLSAIAVSCQDKVPVTDLKFDKSTLVIAIGGTAALKAEFTPLSASNRDVTWNSSNNSIATVEDKSTGAAFAEGLITGKAAGRVTITAISKSGKHEATCTVIVVNAEPELVTVEGGPYTMGCTFDDCDSANLIPHLVTLSTYKIAKHQVTQKQWEAVMGTTPSDIKGDNLPVYLVSWHDVQTFITRLNSFTGKNYRLPTEAEWEYAARGGNKTNRYQYSGSNNLDEVAWYSGNSLTKLHPVGSKKANELGLYDMSGNVWEWCNDWWGLYTDAPQTNPTGPATGTFRIIRGGSYLDPERYSLVVWRSGILPNRTNIVGFRLAHP
ncbi:MAG: SUMF1/EgtB/PvdO family nonheme iron enzyme [Lentimicrobiaceae bacterium]|nr:SUMF1/EgtB/PvdO family nonheme iron enzyme [Lentimicrobiaceae bacterium]